DLGHTPFGHAGQDILNHCMKNYGGFEHNLQSLRIVDALEEKYAEFNGLNLSFESREGILKHCSLTNAKKLGEIGKRFINKQQPGLEAQVTNVGDEIAYNNHDVDDGLRAGLITIDQLCEVKIFAQQHSIVMSAYPELQEKRAIHEIIRRIINVQVTDFLSTTRDLLSRANPASREEVLNQAEPLVGFSNEMQAMNLELKQFLRNNLYRHERVHSMSTKAKNIIQTLFDALINDPKLLPIEQQHNVRELEESDGETGRARSIADYIAGMTDRFAISEHSRIFNTAEPF
ncbi:MAG: deoxyguanosinetriphosphate triphosphohydrolase, partial [Gammaproteobacteria bacterium]|nr:deoxyguanosinetriphosphate triphosphohydrolase [Gammaproteobacteria bacterium]